LKVITLRAAKYDGIKWLTPPHFDSTFDGSVCNQNWERNPHKSPRQFDTDGA
jgi:hypothetical protein